MGIARKWFLVLVAFGFCFFGQSEAKTEGALQMKCMELYEIFEVTIETELRTLPSKMFIRLRHPDGKRIKKVEVNGKRHKNFNAEKEYIELEPGNKKITVIARY